MSSTENEVSREDSTGVSSRMGDELPSRKGGPEGPPDDPNLTPANESMGISEMAVVPMSLGVAPATFKVAELFCRTRFGDAAVSMAFGARPRSGPCDRLEHE